MTLTNDLTPSQIGDLAIRMTLMEPGELVTLALEHPGRVQAVALMAAAASGFMEDDEP